MPRCKGTGPAACCRPVDQGPDPLYDSKLFHSFALVTTMHAPPFPEPANLQMSPLQLAPAVDLENNIAKLPVVYEENRDENTARRWRRPRRRRSGHDRAGRGAGRAVAHERRPVAGEHAGADRWRVNMPTEAPRTTLRYSCSVLQRKYVKQNGRAILTKTLAKSAAILSKVITSALRSPGLVSCTLRDVRWARCASSCSSV